MAGVRCLAVVYSACRLMVSRRVAGSTPRASRWCGSAWRAEALGWRKRLEGAATSGHAHMVCRQNAEFQSQLSPATRTYECLYIENIRRIYPV